MALAVCRNVFGLRRPSLSSFSVWLFVSQPLQQFYNTSNEKPHKVTLCLFCSISTMAGIGLSSRRPQRATSTAPMLFLSLILFYCYLLIQDDFDCCCSEGRHISDLQPHGLLREHKKSRACFQTQVKSYFTFSFQKIRMATCISFTKPLKAPELVCPATYHHYINIFGI